MNVQDLAFFLATYNYDTTLKEGYVELDLDGTCIQSHSQWR